MRLTDEQVAAATSRNRLVNIVSAPGSGKTTVAAERFGCMRFDRLADRRGVLGLSFTQAAARELGLRIKRRWGNTALAFPHAVITFDELHVRIVKALLVADLITWPGGPTALTVVNSYQGYDGYYRVDAGRWRRLASLNANRHVVSISDRVASPTGGLGRVTQHEAILTTGIVSHEDVRNILKSALRLDDLEKFVEDWIARNYGSLIVDEIYDADVLDLSIVALAALGGNSVTLIGDPRQALYGWRGARPERVGVILDAAPFRSYQQSKSFRFEGDQMPALAAALKRGEPVELPTISSLAVDVALARHWKNLWKVGPNILPLAFRSIGNTTDALLNLLLDVATRARLSRSSFGRETALIHLGLSSSDVGSRQDEVLGPLLDQLVAGVSPVEVLEGLRTCRVKLGSTKRAPRLSDDAESQRLDDLIQLRERLRATNLIPGLTVHQAKGCEWDRVGVYLSRAEQSLLRNGLQELEEDDCVVYVALTRAKTECGRLIGPSTIPIH